MYHDVWNPRVTNSPGGVLQVATTNGISSDAQVPSCLDPQFSCDKEVLPSSEDERQGKGSGNTEKSNKGSKNALASSKGSKGHGSGSKSRREQASKNATASSEGSEHKVRRLRKKPMNKRYVSICRYDRQARQFLSLCVDHHDLVDIAKEFDYDCGCCAQDIDESGVCFPHSTASDTSVNPSQMPLHIPSVVPTKLPSEAPSQHPTNFPFVTDQPHASNNNSQTLTSIQSVVSQQSIIEFDGTQFNTTVRAKFIDMEFFSLSSLFGNKVLRVDCSFNSSGSFVALSLADIDSVDRFTRTAQEGVMMAIEVDEFGPCPMKSTTSDNLNETDFKSFGFDPADTAYLSISSVYRGPGNTVFLNGKSANVLDLFEELEINLEEVESGQAERSLLYEACYKAEVDTRNLVDPIFDGDVAKLNLFSAKVGAELCYVPPIPKLVHFRLDPSECKNLIRRCLALTCHISQLSVCDSITSQKATSILKLQCRGV